MWPRISENQKKDGKGQALVGLLLPAGGPWQGLMRGPQAGVGWVGLLAGPPAGRKRSRGASTWAPGAAAVRRNMVVKAFAALVPGVDAAPAKSRQSTATNACWWCGAPDW